MSQDAELERERVRTLEQILEVQERVSQEASKQLEVALAEARARADALARAERDKEELVAQLRSALDELSTPVLEVWEDVLAIPIIGIVDSRRAAQIMERVLEETSRRQAEHVILDVTGVDVIDSRTAEHFTKLIRAIELIGARCALSGVRPAVGQSLVDLGLELGNVRTVRNLKHALRDAIRRSSATKQKGTSLKAEPDEES